jgi:hypothetical protein
MSGPIMMYAASFILLGWGLAHIFPTGSVVRGFGELSTENKRIITMEWIIEGVSLVFIGSLVTLTTYIDRTSLLAKTVYMSCIVVLNVLSIISVFTGFRNSFIAFRLCPFIFTGSSVLIAVGGILS